MNPGARPHPPGDYPVVVIGSGPGGLQVGYCLDRLGVRYAHISADDAPGGMFRRFPIFQRLISWTKLHAVEQPGTREYERYDWNSLIADERENQALVASVMDGTSYFPARAEMERGHALFSERARLRIRYSCPWTGTRRDDRGVVVETPDGDYRSPVVVFAIGVAEPWKPSIHGLDLVPHYAETKEPKDYAGRRVFVIGKRNSGFEIADGLLPTARQIVLASPRPAALSVITRSLVGARARYVQPYEDHLLAGGNVVLDAAIERVERTTEGYRVHAQGTTVPGRLEFDVDDAIAATGFKVPLGDLPSLGVATFNEGRLPAVTPLWESATVPGIYFAGSVSQAAGGLNKYGLGNSSAAVHGFRYNARVLCRHVAEKHLGLAIAKPPVAAEDLVDRLLHHATKSPELWNQRAYLARAIERAEDGSLRDLDVVPLAHFIDSPGPDAVAVTVESDTTGDIHPALYVRRGGRVTEHILPSARFHDYRTDEHRAQVASAVADLH